MKKRLTTRTVSLFLAFLFALTALPPAEAYAAGNFTVTGGSASAQPGEYVNIPFTAANNPGVAAYSLGFSYNKDILTPIGVYNNAGGQFVGNLKGPDLATGGTTGTPGSTGTPGTTGTGYVVWTGGGDYDRDGDLFTLRFQIKPTARSGAVSQVGLFASDSEPVINASYQSVSYQTINGQVTVSKPSYGDVNLDKAVDVIDLILLMQYLAKMAELDGVALANADVYPDGVIDARDVLLLQQHLLKPTLYTPGEIPV